MKPGKKLSDSSWYPNAVAICIGVVLFVALTHMDKIQSVLKGIGELFMPVLLGCVIAYLMNPLAMMLQRTFFQNMKRKTTSWTLSVFLSAAILIGLFILLLLTLIPQLIESVSVLVNNIDGYVASLRALLESLGLENQIGGLNIDALVNSSEDLLEYISAFVVTNLKSFLSASAGVGRGLLNLVIAAILSIYLLCAKESLRSGSRRLLKALLPDETYGVVITFLKRCNNILLRYIVFSIVDAVIIGCANALFMAALGMQYIGLVSVVVGVMNLIPTFGPLIGAAIGGFILVLVNPMHALLFVIFTLILQTLDGYIIKPKLFGDTLGVSGLLILISVVVCGNLFGVLGILLAIPLAAIVDFVYREGLIPWLEKRKLRHNNNV